MSFDQEPIFIRVLRRLAEHVRLGKISVEDARSMVSECETAAADPKVAEMLVLVGNSIAEVAVRGEVVS